MAATNINNKKHANRRWRGTSTLEAAFVLVLLLMVTLGTIGWGWFFLRVQQVTNASRQGARVAIRYGATVPEVKDVVDGLLSPFALEYEDPIITPYIDPNIGEAVTVTVKGIGLDILNLNSEGIIMVPIPDYFKCSVTMAKEGQ